MNLKEFLIGSLIVIAMTLGFMTLATGRVDCLDNGEAGQTCFVGGDK